MSTVPTMFFRGSCDSRDKKDEVENVYNKSNMINQERQEEEKSSGTNEQSAGAVEEDLRTQFLLGLIDENGNPTLQNESQVADNPARAAFWVSGSRFVVD